MGQGGRGYILVKCEWSEDIKEEGSLTSFMACVEV